MKETNYKFILDQNSHYSELKKIGFGGFSTVFSGLNRVSAENEAIKIMKPDVTDESLQEEVKVLSRLSHPNILKYKTSLLIGEFRCLITELCEEGTLKQYLRENEDIILEDKLKLIMGIGKGIKYLHSMGVMHRDIKPQNIFLKEGLPKIGNLGISKHLKEILQQTQAHTQIGTHYYCAPEIYEGEFSDSVDIWAFGCILYEILEDGKVAFGDANEFTRLEKIRGFQIPELKEENQRFKKIIQMCICHKGERHRIENILEKLKIIQREIGKIKSFKKRRRRRKGRWVKEKHYHITENK